MIANSCRLFNNTEEKIMKLKEFINKAVSVAMCAMIIGTTVVSVNVKADTKVSMEATDALDTHIDDGVAGILEKDDFENPEDYQKYLESHPQLQKQQRRLAARASANFFVFGSANFSSVTTTKLLLATLSERTLARAKK